MASNDKFMLEDNEAKSNIKLKHMLEVDRATSNVKFMLQAHGAALNYNLMLEASGGLQ